MPQTPLHCCVLTHRACPPLNYIFHNMPPLLIFLNATLYVYECKWNEKVYTSRVCVYVCVCVCVCVCARERERECVCACVCFPYSTHTHTHTSYHAWQRSACRLVRRLSTALDCPRLRPQNGSLVELAPSPSAPNRLLSLSHCSLSARLVRRPCGSLYRQLLAWVGSLLV